MLQRRAVLVVEDDADKKISIDEYSRSLKEPPAVNVLDLGDNRREDDRPLRPQEGKGIDVEDVEGEDASDAKAES